jgi:hypothetical protein
MTHRPGIIPLGPIAQSTLDELRVITLAASNYDWEWTHSGTATQEAALEYMADMLAHSDRTDLNLVMFNDDGEIPYAVAITGNGKDSEANARFICAAQPVNVFRLLAEIERLKGLL